MQLAGGPLGLAFGAEYRKEKFDFDPRRTAPDRRHLRLRRQLPADRPLARRRARCSAKLNIPIVKSLEANVAVRYDHYEGVGSSTTPKASLRWQPMPQLLLRGSFGRGFRAPSLQDLYLPQQTGVTTRRPERPGALPGHQQRQRLPDPVQRAARRRPEPQAREVEELHARHRARAGEQRLVRHRLLQRPSREHDRQRRRPGDHPRRHDDSTPTWSPARRRRRPTSRPASRARSRRSTRPTSTSGTTKTSRPRLRPQVAHPDGGHGALHHQRHGHLLHRVRHLEPRRLVHAATSTASIR